MTEREQRMTSVLRRARRGGGLALSERALAIIGSALAAIGVVLVVAGWAGTSRTVLVAGQIPYVVSGGLLGLAFVFLGGFLYFAYWLAVTAREARERESAQAARFAELTAAVTAMSRAVSDLARSSPAAHGAGNNGAGNNAPALVATPSGTMAHTPTCPVVAHRDDLRPVTVDEGLTACGICAAQPLT